jgi:hypothetical protein
MMTKTMKNPSMKIPTSMCALAVSVAGLGNAAAETITIDRDYNGGASIAEYTAWDTANPFNGLANYGNGQFSGGTSVGATVEGTNLRRPSFFFAIPTGYTSAQIRNATLRVRLHSKMNPMKDLTIYSAALDTLGTKDGAYAKSTFSDESFADTGLRISTDAATRTNYEFDVTSLVREALDLNLPTTVIGFRFQMMDDTSLERGIPNSYTFLGFETKTPFSRPALTLEVIPEPGAP